MTDQQREDYKVLKRQLSEAQLLIKHSLADDSLPKNEEVTLFSELSAKMEQLSMPAWKTAMQVYMEQLTLFEKAVQEQDLANAKEAFAGLMDVKAAGHTQFRKK